MSANTSINEDVETEDVDDNDELPLVPPEHARRKSSFSDTLNKFASNHFGRRRTATNLPHSESSGNIYHNSRLPTASGIRRSSSFFGSFSAFSKQTTPVNENGLQNNGASPPAAIRASRKISERLASTPFFKNQHLHRNTTAPVDPPKPKERRDSGVQIKHHGLMAPINPPLPRSRTMGNLGQGGSPRTPSFMRPTTSSAARRESVVMQQGQKHTPPPVPRARHRLSSVSEKSSHSASTPTQKRTSSVAEKAANIERALPRLIMEEDGQRTSTPIKLAASPSPPDTAKDLEDKALTWGLEHASSKPNGETTPVLSQSATIMPEVDDWKYKPVGRRPSRPSLPRNYSKPLASPHDIPDKPFKNDEDIPFMGDEDRRKYEIAKQAMQMDTTPTKKNRNFRNLTLPGLESDEAKKDSAAFETLVGERNIGVGSIQEEEEIGFEYDSDDSLTFNPAAVSSSPTSTNHIQHHPDLTSLYFPLQAMASCPLPFWLTIGFRESLILLPHVIILLSTPTSYSTFHLCSCPPLTSFLKTPNTNTHPRSPNPSPPAPGSGASPPSLTATAPKPSSKPPPAAAPPTPCTTTTYATAARSPTCTPSARPSKPRNPSPSSREPLTTAGSAKKRGRLLVGC